VLKSRQLRGWERKYLVKWKGYHPIEASWVNEFDMEHAQEAIKEFHTRLAKRQKRRRMWWGHHLSFSGARSHINVPHQVASEIKVKNFQEIISWLIANKVVKWHWTNGTSLHRPKSKSNSYFGVKRNLDPKRRGKQGELAGTCTCLECIPKGWLVVTANAGSHDPVCVL
jgi:hypothetical protein